MGIELCQPGTGQRYRPFLASGCIVIASSTRIALPTANSAFALSRCSFAAVTAARRSVKSARARRRPAPVTARPRNGRRRRGHCRNRGPGTCSPCCRASPSLVPSWCRLHRAVVEIGGSAPPSAPLTAKPLLLLVRGVRMGATAGPLRRMRRHGSSADGGQHDGSASSGTRNRQWKNTPQMIEQTDGQDRRTTGRNLTVLHRVL